MSTTTLEPKTDIDTSIDEELLTLIENLFEADEVECEYEHGCPKHSDCQHKVKYRFVSCSPEEDKLLCVVGAQHYVTQIMYGLLDGLTVCRDCRRPIKECWRVISV